MLSKKVQARSSSQLDREGWLGEHQMTVGDNRGRAQSRASLDGEELMRVGRLCLSLHHSCCSALIARRGEHFVLVDLCKSNLGSSSRAVASQED